MADWFTNQAMDRKLDPKLLRQVDVISQLLNFIIFSGCLLKKNIAMNSSIKSHKLYYKFNGKTKKYQLQLRIDNKCMQEILALFILIQKKTDFTNN